MLLVAVTVGLLIMTLTLLRLVYVLWSIHAERKLKRPLTTGRTKSSIMVVLGSGGHTKEMITFMGAVGEKFSPRYYVAAETDRFSIEKVMRLQEKIHDQNYEMNKIPRSREVRQSYFSSLLTTTKALVFTLPLVVTKRPDVLLCNGPGTCIPVCIACFILKIFCISHTKIVYVESICRVTTLSLSGKLLYYFADSFIVQWPDLALKFNKANYIGRLM